jgi:hypothetical protein
MEYYNHLKIGGQEFIHKGKRIISSINSLDMERYVNNFKNYDYDIGIVPAGFEHRADLISEVFYNTPTLDWLICWANDVSDPFQQLNVGDTLKIPKLI